MEIEAAVVHEESGPFAIETLGLEEPRTPTPTATSSTPTDADSNASGDGESAAGTETTEASGPGFGIVGALVALLATRRR